MNTDYLIVGQGLAGSLLSWFLMQEGATVAVLDNGNPAASSRIAAGICDPITGQRMVKTWNAATFIPYAEATYQELEAFFQDQFYHRMNIFKMFVSPKQKTTWESRLEEPGFLDFHTKGEVEYWPENIYNNPYGGVELKGSGYLDTAHWLSTYRNWLKDRDGLIEADLDLQDLSFANGQVHWKDQVNAQKVIFCEGHRGADNPYFHFLPFQRVKGELFTLKIPGLESDKIINRGSWLLPLGEGYFRAGATYEWHAMDEKPSNEGYRQLVEKVQKMVHLDFEVVDHVAGIRPALLTTKPVAGLLPDLPEIGVFNGLGSKGVTQGPYLIHNFARYLAGKEELHEDINIVQFLNVNS